MKNRLKCFLCLVFPALALAGCGVFNGLFGDGTTFSGSRQVDFRISDELNNDHPVAVELVVVYDKAVEEVLLKLTGASWFAQREQYLRDFSGEKLQTWKWEWTPGQVTEPQKFRYSVGALSTIIFASYASPGNHRARVEPNKHLHMALLEDRFEVKTSP